MPKTKVRNKTTQESIGVQEARDNLKEILDRVQFKGERVVVTRYGNKAAALVSMDDLKKIEAA